MRRAILCYFGLHPDGSTYQARWRGVLWPKCAACERWLPLGD